jgi:hypothetical protein
VFQIAVIAQPRWSAAASTGSACAGSTTIVSRAFGIVDQPDIIVAQRGDADDLEVLAMSAS